MKTFNSYQLENNYVIKILTAGGGLMNGNAYQEIEAHYNNKEDSENMEEATLIFLCEYGKNPKRELLPETYIKWNNENEFTLS